MSRRRKIPYNQTFEKLVSSETDIVGLIAYGIYKINKRSEIITFQDKHKRPPTPEELNGIVASQCHKNLLELYELKANQLLDAAMEALASAKDMPPTETNTPPSTGTDQPNPPFTMDNQPSTSKILDWIPKQLRPVVALLFLGAMAFFAYQKFIPKAEASQLQSPPQSPCPKYTLIGEAEPSRKGTAVKIISVEKAVYSEDDTVVDGKFLITMPTKPEEITLILEYENTQYKPEKKSVYLKNYQANADCEINIGHVKF